MPCLRIGYFHHIPFPATEVLKIHPARDLLLQGLLGADVIGFHTLEYVRAFSGAVSRILGHEQAGEDLHVEDRVCRVGAFPLGADCSSLSQCLSSAEHQEAFKVLQGIYPPSMKVLLGVDRLDYTKGIPERLAVFEGLLRSHPELQGKVALVMLCVPSRVGVGKYSDLRETIERAVGKINGEMGKPGWVPVHYYFQTCPLAELTALYRRADVCMVTPLRDGLNLVCKEYCVCQQDGMGVLLLSEFAGAAHEMSEALLVNPNDQTAMISALYSALTMDTTEKQERMNALRARVLQADNRRWSRDFLAAVTDIAAKNDKYRSRLLDVAMAHQLRSSLRAYTGSGPATSKAGLLMVLDADMVPGSSIRERSRTSMSILPLVLSMPPRQLVLVTSAGREYVDACWPVTALPCWFIAERGALMRTPTGEWCMQAGYEPLGSFRAEVMRTLSSRASLVPESDVVEGAASVAWRMAKTTGLSLAAPIVLETCHALDQLLARSSYMCARTAIGLIVRQSQHTVLSALNTLISKLGLEAPTTALTIGNGWSDMSMYEWDPVRLDVSQGTGEPVGSMSMASFVAGRVPPAFDPAVVAPPQSACAQQQHAEQVKANISVAVGTPISLARFVVPNISQLAHVLQELIDD